MDKIMKRLLKILYLLIILSLSIALSSCGDFSIQEWMDDVSFQYMNNTPSEGLEFRLNEDGNSYSVWNIGFCTDEYVIIPDTYKGLPVTSVYSCAFSGCTSIKRVKIPNSVVTIDMGAFDYCSSLETIVIPESVTNIVYSPFEDCTSLKNIVVNKNNQHYKSIDGNLYSKDEKTLIRYAIGKEENSFTIPDFVTSIGSFAFEDANFLESIFMPDSVTKIGNHAFSWCTSLKSIRLSNSIDEIPWGMFNYCTSLIDVVIPNSVTSISKDAFNRCESLLKIEIPKTVTVIEESTFSGCESLQSIYIPDSVTEIDAYAFSCCESLTKIVIPDSVERINVFAFNYCRKLTVYCEAKTLPSGWRKQWKPDYVSVVWRYAGN